MRRVILVFIAISLAFSIGTAKSFPVAQIPASILAAKKAVFRIVFFPPSDRTTRLSIKDYENQIEGQFSTNSLLGNWVRKVGNECREKKLQTCPVLVDWIRSEGKTLYSTGTAFLVGSNKNTVLTAPHVWSSFFEFATDRASQPINPIKKDEIIGRSVGFALLDEEWNVVYDTRDDSSSAQVSDYAIPELIQQLHPELKIDTPISGMEYLAIHLNKPIDRTPLLFREVTLPSSSKENFYALGFPSDPEYTSGPALSISVGPRTTEMVDSFKKSVELGFIPNNVYDSYVEYSFVLDMRVYAGMSGGPILDSEGRVVSLISIGQKIISNYVIGQPLQAAQIRSVLLGPHPKILKDLTQHP